MNCKKCGVELNKDNKKTYLGTTYSSCKKCIHKKQLKYSRNRQKLTNQSNWAYQGKIKTGE